MREVPGYHIYGFYIPKFEPGPHKVMMKCRAGTISLRGTDSSLHWVYDMHTITVSVHETREDAELEVARLTPIGFNREQISLWIE